MKKLVIASAMVLALSACSTRSANQPLEVWQNYQVSQISNTNLQHDQALAVFYRQNNIKGSAVNVYVNGDYQTSLLPNSFSSVPVCANKQMFSSSFVEKGKFGNRKDGVSYTLPAKKIVYIKVVNGKNGQPEFEQVDEATAVKDLTNLKKVSHTLSRAKFRCHSVILSQVSFSAGALFGVNKSSYEDILAAGRKEITAFAEQVKAFDAAKISKVEVNGYTDPEGSDTYNLRLSEKRAQAVALALKNANVTNKIEAKGHGETGLVAKECHLIKSKSERAACNQPNRRVEVTVYGNR